MPQTNPHVFKFPTGWNAQSTVIEHLRLSLRDYDRRRARGAGWTRGFVPTGLSALDAALPHGGLPTGAITEILADQPGIGSMTLALRIAARCIEGEPSSPSDHRPVVVVDPHGDFYPPAAWQRGIAPARLIVLRPRRAEDAAWALDQTLRCPGVGAVVARLDRLDEQRTRRLQLAAESNGCPGILLRSARSAGRSFAAVQILLEGLPAEERANLLAPPAATGEPCFCRITLRKVREGMPVEPLLVDLDHETGAVHSSALPVDRPAAVRIA